MSSRTRARAPSGTIHRTIALLHAALRGLDADMPLAEEERIAVMVNQAMTQQARSFHTPEHVFDLVRPGRPRATLACLFHDLVYYQVDQGFVAQVAKLVQSSIEARDETVRVRPVVEPGDRSLAITLAVFGVKPGQILSPFGGMNEFLSALVMNRTFAGVVREEDLLVATACVEATIPFRATDPGGPSPSDTLAARLAEAGASLGLGFTADKVRDAVREAVAFSNADVSNFAENEVTRFLDNTWKLLPETNPSLRFQGVYTIRSYRAAMQKMEGFLRTLDPNTIFARYEGVPSEREYARRLLRARRNVTTARAYLGIKLLTAALLEALAEISGGDAPMSLFMGDIGERRKGSKLEDYLPHFFPPEDLALDVTLHDLLAHGRGSASSFDLQNSPVSLFIYRHLGTDGFASFLESARRMFDGSLEPRVFLESLPRSLVIPIAEGCARMALTRRPVLTAFAASLKAGPDRAAAAPRRRTGRRKAPARTARRGARRVTSRRRARR